jgi:hypothetical protein
MRDDMQFACLPRRGAGGLRRGRRIAYSMVRGKIDSATMATMTQAKSSCTVGVVPNR